MLTREDVLKISELARLTLEDGELEMLVTELNSILQYVDRLREIESKGLDAMSHVHGAVNVFRPDEVKEAMSAQELLRNAPDTSGRYLRVPIVIEQQD